MIPLRDHKDPLVSVCLAQGFDVAAELTFEVA